MPAAIQVERDTAGLQLAVRTLFEEAFMMHQVDLVVRMADEETRARALDEIPAREISPGYFQRAAYLLDLSLSLELGISFASGDLARVDVAGLAAVRAAKADYEREHPPCPACGERQSVRGLGQCEHCPAKFAGRGD